MFTCTVYTLSIEKHNFISVCRFISSVNFSAMFKLVKKIDKCFRFSNELKCCLSARNILCTLAYIRPEPCIPFRWKFLRKKLIVVRLGGAMKNENLQHSLNARKPKIMQLCKLKLLLIAVECKKTNCTLCAPNRCGRETTLHFIRTL